MFDFFLSFFLKRKSFSERYLNSLWFAYYLVRIRNKSINFIIYLAKVEIVILIWWKVAVRFAFLLSIHSTFRVVGMYQFLTQNCRSREAYYIPTQVHTTMAKSNPWLFCGLISRKLNCSSVIGVWVLYRTLMYTNVWISQVFGYREYYQQKCFSKIQRLHSTPHLLSYLFVRIPLCTL